MVNKKSMFYVNKLLVLDQDLLVRICGKLNNDKKVKNNFKNVHRENAKEVDWGNYGKMVTKICRLKCIRPVSISLTNSYNIFHLFSGIYTVLIPFLRKNRNILVEYRKHFLLSKICLSKALSRMFKVCVYVSLPDWRSFWSLVRSSIKKRLEAVEVERNYFI